MDSVDYIYMCDTHTFTHNNNNNQRNTLKTIKYWQAVLDTKSNQKIC